MNVISVWICGIDEAGRGPVLGPLVVALCGIPNTDISLLGEQSIDDSKVLSKHKREKIVAWFEEKKTTHRWKCCIVVCEPEEIDIAVYENNLNLLEAQTFSKVIQLFDCHEHAEIIADACDTIPERFTNRIISHCKDWSNRNYALKSEHKADSNHQIVALASILAKHHRDLAIEQLKQQLGIEIGSGYPSDPNTQNSLSHLICLPQPHDCVRWSWKTVQNFWDAHFDVPLPIRSSYGLSHQTTLF